MRELGGLEKELATLLHTPKQQIDKEDVQRPEPSTVLKPSQEGTSRGPPPQPLMIPFDHAPSKTTPANSPLENFSSVYDGGEEGQPYWALAYSSN